MKPTDVSDCLSQLDRLFPQSAWSDDERRLFAEKIKGLAADSVVAVIREYKATDQKVARTPTLARLVFLCRNASNQRLQTAPSQRQDPTMTLEETVNYYRNIANRQRQQGGVMAFLVLDCHRDLAPFLGGDVLEDAVRTCCGMDAKEMREIWRDNDAKHGEPMSKQRTAANMVADLERKMTAKTNRPKSREMTGLIKDSVATDGTRMN